MVDESTLDYFYKNPEHAHAMMTRQELLELLMKTEGVIVARGEFWHFHHRHLGAGAYRVHLEKKSENE